MPLTCPDLVNGSQSSFSPNPDVASVLPETSLQAAGFHGKVIAFPVLGNFQRQKESPGQWGSLGAVLGGLKSPYHPSTTSTTSLMLDPLVLVLPPKITESQFVLLSEI